MKFAIPCLYASYGRFSSSRKFPSKVDSLMLVERRLLVSLHTVARKKFTKAATVVGHCMGHLHPHGDLSIYGTLKKLVDYGFAIGEGNWGSRGLHKKDNTPAAMRYVECKLAPWIDEMGFKYIDYVPHEIFDFGKEPLYLPTPLPLGLIGEGLNVGIAFDTCVLPKYTISDLAKRLSWLLKHNMVIEDITTLPTLNEKLVGPKIIPNSKDCTVVTSDLDAYNILINGMGKIQYIPYGDAKQKNCINILGLAPASAFTKLISAIEASDDSPKKLHGVEAYDESGESICVKIEILKKNKRPKDELVKEIWTKYLNANKSIRIITTTEDGPENIGVDDILMESYQHWYQARFNKRYDDVVKLLNLKHRLSVILIIRSIIQKYNCKTIHDIISVYQSNPDLAGQTITRVYDQNTHSWNDSQPYQITQDDIKTVCAKGTIRQLVEINIDLSQTDKDIIAAEQHLYNLNVDCINYIDSLI